MNAHSISRYLALLTLLAGCLQARGGVPPTKEARARAELYQSAARTVLADAQWTVSTDQPGKLVANHRLGFEGAQFPGTAPPDFGLVACLTITFLPESPTATSCHANIVHYSYSKSPSEIKPSLKGPWPFKNPETVKFIRDTLAKAEQKMVAEHPEFAAK